jgi:neutral ceramidase
MNRIKTFFVFTLLFGMLFSIPDTYSFCNTGEIYVGAAKADITPPVGTRIFGGYSREGPSSGLHDPLYIRALVLDVDGYRVGIISCDLIKYCNKRVIDTAKERFNISHLLICSSHTHSGPTLGDYDSPDHDLSYALRVEKAMIDGLEKAVASMFPARISAGYKSFPPLGYNRLVNRGDAPAMWRNVERIPYGPVDPEVGVIKIEDKEGSPRVIIMQYACHPVVNGINYDISADYPGVAAKIVEEKFGNNTICMFVQGGAGDINPMFMSEHVKDGIETDYGMIEKTGTILGNEVIALTNSLSPRIRGEVSLKAISDSLEFTKRFDKDHIFNIHFTTVLINNDIAIASFLGEPLVWNQFYWKKNAEAAHPFFFGYTYSSGGDFPGYVPDIRSASYGGYGADDDYIIQVGAGEAIMNRHLENFYRIKGVLKDELVIH